MNSSADEVSIDPTALGIEVHLDPQMWSLPMGIAESTLAPAVLRLPRNEEAVGSNPATPTPSKQLRGQFTRVYELAPEC